MEPHQLTFKINPYFLEQFSALLQMESIPFTFTYEASFGLAGCFLVTIERPMQAKLPFDMIVSTSQVQIIKDKERLEFLLSIDRDYERIRSDMKALIFHATLSQPPYKATEKRKSVFELLHSDLSKNLRPPLRKRAS